MISGRLSQRARRSARRRRQDQHETWLDGGRIDDSRIEGQDRFIRNAEVVGNASEVVPVANGVQVAGAD